MRTLTRTVLVAVASAALLAPALPAQAATVLDTEVYKVQPSGKKVRFQLLLKDEGVVVLTFAVRRAGEWKRLDKAVVGGTYVEGSSEADVLDVTQDYEGAPEDGGQGLVTWQGPTDDEDYAEYFGFSLQTGELDMYGG